MKEINYKKILGQLIREFPHELDKIEKIINDAKADGQDLYIEFGDIIDSRIWFSDEKARLLTFFGYDKSEHRVIYRDNHNIPRNVRGYLYAIITNNLSGFEALMMIFKDIKEHHIDAETISKDEAYRMVFQDVISNCKEASKVSYIKTILDNLTNDDIKRLVAPYYKGSIINNVHDESIMIYIIGSKDLDLIKKYIDYVDINMYLSEAVATGSIEIVKLFLEKGADINYLSDEVILARLTPLKTAIVNNDYEMAKYLIDNGADINLQVDGEDFINRLNNYQIEVFDMYHNIKPVKENDDDAQQFKYIRTSLPLEYATKLRKTQYKNDSCYSCFDVRFNGETLIVNNNLLVDMSDISEEVKNRGKIVDLIFDKLEDKSNINYNDLISFTFITRDSEKFKKYSKYAKDNNYQIDFDLLFKLYFEFHMNKEKEMIIPIMDLIKEYDKDNDIYLKLFYSYLTNVIRDCNIYKFYVDDFIKELLNRISENKRKEICLVPYCRNLESLEYLISIGFDIRQTDDEWGNILYYLLCNRGKKEDLTDKEMYLFNYLINNSEFMNDNKYNEAVLYHAMQRFDTEDEWQYARKEIIGTRTKLEKAVAMLISKMPKEAVCNDDIQRVLDGRTKLYSDFGEKIDMKYVYQHHRELFDALIDKGFVLSDEVLEDILAALYPSQDEHKERLKNTIDMDKTFDFLYQRLDHNVQIQKINIKQIFNDFMINLDSENITFEEFLKGLNYVNYKIDELKEFYEKNIMKKYSPGRYLQYAKEKFNTTYENLDGYLTLIIIKAIRKFGSDRLIDILNAITNYNINNYVVDADIDYDYWDYIAQINSGSVDEDANHVLDNEHFEAERVLEDDGNILFTGGLMQYAILTDDLPMVKLLQEKDANFKFVLNDVDHTWDYVNSYTILRYIESFIGKKGSREMNEKEKEYYLKLFGSDNQGDDAPQILSLKRDE